MKRNVRNSRSRKRKCKQSSSKSTNAIQLCDALDWLVGDSLRNIATHGNTKWEPTSLAILALLWSISDASTLGRAFRCAHTQAIDLFGSAAVSTYQGLLKALVSYGPALRSAISRSLQCKAKQLLGERFWEAGWALFAIDGSTSRPPRSRSNERAFISNRYGKSKNAKHRKQRAKNKPSSVKPAAPRILITMIWQMTAKLPWAWNLGQAGSSERGCTLELLQTERFVKNSLFVADAGFVGYPLWIAIEKLGHSFLVRVGKNVQFLQDEASVFMRRNNRVYYWPDKHARKNDQPMVLRLIRLTIGNRKMVLVTNVLDRSRLTDKMALKFYKLRWGIELEFRGLKQVFKRSKLRCKNSDRCLQELDWSILAMSVVECFTLRVQCESSQQAQIPRTSLALSLEVFRDTLATPHQQSEPNAFAARIANAVFDNYSRKSMKQGRHRPSGKSRPPTGLPVLVALTNEQRLKLQEIQLTHAA
jgi:hypothetical protein